MSQVDGFNVQKSHHHLPPRRSGRPEIVHRIWDPSIRSSWEPDARPTILAFVAWRPKSARIPSPAVQAPGHGTKEPHGRRSTSQSHPHASLWLCALICRGVNASGNGADAKQLRFQDPRHPPLRFTALFAVAARLAPCPRSCPTTQLPGIHLVSTPASCRSPAKTPQHSSIGVFPCPSLAPLPIVVPTAVTQRNSTTRK